MRLLKVISGGQTGVDRAALDTAQAFDLPVGGWCPKGRRAEDGPIPARLPPYGNALSGVRATYNLERPG